MAKPAMALCRIDAFIHTGVGFGVARSTDWAMPEPQSVERVTGRLPRFFFVYQPNLCRTAMMVESHGIFLKNRMKSKITPLIIGSFFLGMLCATWQDIWSNERTETVMAASLFISLITLLLTNYFTVESALELRGYNRKKMFGDYCNRFSNDQNVKKVAEWLLFIFKSDSNGNIIKCSNKSKNRKGKAVYEPTLFEKECFLGFLIELNIQIKNKQIERDDAKRMFSFYARLFDKVLQTESETTCYKRDKADISELLSE